jgi:ATP-binding cassette subfamily C protein CydC
VVALIGVAGWAFLGLATSLPAGQGPDGPWLVALTLLVLGTGEALLGLPAAWLELPGTARAARRLTDLAEQRPEPAYPEATSPLPLSFDLALEAVCFAYQADQPVLTDLTLHLAEGTHVALLGPSGEGKTTLVRLLTRLEDPTAGAIRLGGRDLRDWSEPELRTVVSGSLQDPWIFTATMAENLRLAAPDADEAELWRVLEVVGLAPQVRAWPEGLETWIEEGGQSLSGGQRRRLALARALLKRAQVTVLDEPTEGLEAEAAESLVQAVRQELRGKTLLWVTHRPQGLGDFPVIWTMRKGRIEAP